MALRLQGSAVGQIQQMDVFRHEDIGPEMEAVAESCRRDGLDGPLTGTVVRQEGLSAEATEGQGVRVIRFVEATASLPVGGLWFQFVASSIHGDDRIGKVACKQHALVARRDDPPVVCLRLRGHVWGSSAWLMSGVHQAVAHAHVFVGMPPVVS
jgi:hypothetical protein